MAALYIHVPFCAKKCRYCDFVSFDCKNELIHSYFESLCGEIKITSGLYGIHGVSTVFFGGGTPSFVDEKYIAQTLETVQKYIGINTAAEISLEANPNSLSKKKLLSYQRIGINRLSMGLQSANNRILRGIGRLHTLELFEKAYGDARGAGFENMNIDVMYGLPGQTPDDFNRTLETVAAFSPRHVSAYSLTIEPGTPMHGDLMNGKIKEADEDTERGMYHAAVAYLKDAGLQRYEISNFAKKGFECAHNLAYWNRDDYLGVGLAAHSCIRDVRYANTADIGHYISCLSDGKTAYNTIETLDAGQIETEYIMLKLRLSGGFEIREYERLFNRNFNDFFAVALQKLHNAGLAQQSDGRFFATCKGFDLQNTVVLELLNIL